MGCPAAGLQPWLPPPFCLPFFAYGAFLGIFFLADSQHSSAGDTHVALSLPPRTQKLVGRLNEQITDVKCCRSYVWGSSSAQRGAVIWEGPHVWSTLKSSEIGLKGPQPLASTPALLNRIPRKARKALSCNCLLNNTNMHLMLHLIRNETNLLPTIQTIQEDKRARLPHAAPPRSATLGGQARLGFRRVELRSRQRPPPSLRTDFRMKQGRRRRTFPVSCVLGPLECEARKSFRSGKKSRECMRHAVAGLL